MANCSWINCSVKNSIETQAQAQAQLRVTVAVFLARLVSSRLGCFFNQNIMVFPAVRAQSARICCGKSMLFLGLFFRLLWRLCRRFDLTCLLAGRLTLSLCSTLMWFVSVVDYRLPTPLFAGLPTTPGHFCISSLAFFYGFPTAFVWRSRLVCCPLLLLFCWRAIRQARHGCQSWPPGDSHTAIRCIYSKRSRSIANHLWFCFSQGLYVVNQSHLRFKFLAASRRTALFLFLETFDICIAV